MPSHPTVRKTLPPQSAPQTGFRHHLNEGIHEATPSFVTVPKVTRFSRATECRHPLRKPVAVIPSAFNIPSALKNDTNQLPLLGDHSPKSTFSYLLESYPEQSANRTHNDRQI